MVEQFRSRKITGTLKGVELGEDKMYGFCALDEKRDKNFRPFMASCLPNRSAAEGEVNSLKMRL